METLVLPKQIKAIKTQVEVLASCTKRRRKAVVFATPIIQGGNLLNVIREASRHTHTTDGTKEARGEIVEP
jgi:hypothetical protein